MCIHVRVDRPSSNEYRCYPLLPRLAVMVGVWSGEKSAISPWPARPLDRSLHNAECALSRRRADLFSEVDMDLEEPAGVAKQEGVAGPHALIVREPCKPEPIRTRREVGVLRTGARVLHGVEECAARWHLRESRRRLAHAAWTPLAKRVRGDRKT
jgi:hypothetical protein